ncbi:uncharacterized protein LOC108163678 [Drosophila miranda]|uniref:uncharacterized protein LOC108163678 n=1 Tax=Drosophila miranda TaxID=7229 RepID=UPI0007E87CB0|nr:uncharacterized protein LOC108163678 [Drosophila miranda]
MEATRIFMLLQILATLLLVEVSGCSQACQAFVGLNGCSDNGSVEPNLPPRDNTCCGPHCVYTAPNAGSACSNTATDRCLLDTSCSNGQRFNMDCISECALQTKNQGRIANGLAPLISFGFGKDHCDGLNTKCGQNCCCRETCPTQFCKF